MNWLKTRFSRVLLFNVEFPYVLISNRPGGGFGGPGSGFGGPGGGFNTGRSSGKPLLLPVLKKPPPGPPKPPPGPPNLRIPRDFLRISKDS